METYSNNPICNGDCSLRFRALRAFCASDIAFLVSRVTTLFFAAMDIFMCVSGLAVMDRKTSARLLRSSSERDTFFCAAPIRRRTSIDLFLPRFAVALAAICSGECFLPNWATLILALSASVAFHPIVLPATGATLNPLSRWKDFKKSIQCCSRPIRALWSEMTSSNSNENACSPCLSQDRCRGFEWWSPLRKWRLCLPILASTLMLDPTYTRPETVLRMTYIPEMMGAATICFSTSSDGQSRNVVASGEPARVFSISNWFCQPIRMAS